MPKLLVVEDNEDLAILYQRSFKDIETDVVGTAWDAIAKLEKNTYQLVILDMHLPEVPGMVVLHHIRKMPGGDKINVFIVSADDTLRGKATQVGIQAWMTKPIEIDALVEAAAPYFQQEA